MRCKSLGAMVVLILSLCPCYAQNQANKNNSIIKKLERELERALFKGDSATLDRILADDYVEIDAQGGVKKKVDVISVARARSAASRGVSIGPDKTIDDLSVRLHGDSALVVGRTTIRYQFMENQGASPQTPSRNPLIINQEWFVRAYAKVNGRWQLVAWQTTSIAKR